MKSKKLIADTIGIGIGAVGISQANTLPVYGGVIGASMGAGMATHMLRKERRRN